jgi:hypothetical protein
MSLRLDSHTNLPALGVLPSVSSLTSPTRMKHVPDFVPPSPTVQVRKKLPAGVSCLVVVSWLSRGCLVVVLSCLVLSCLVLSCSVLSCLFRVPFRLFSVVGSLPLCKYVC